MNEALKIDVVTIFPQMLNGFLQESMMKRASEAGLVEFRVINPRDFTTDKHNKTDDRPFGGGPGMVMKPEPLFAAVESIQTPESLVILMTPSGKTFEQSTARQLADDHNHLIFICGHYEGVDERVREALVDEEISIGDYVLTNGVLSAAVVIDAVARLRPGVLGGGEIATEDALIVDVWGGEGRAGSQRSSRYWSAEIASIDRSVLLTCSLTTEQLGSELRKTRPYGLLEILGSNRTTIP